MAIKRSKLTQFSPADKYSADYYRDLFKQSDMAETDDEHINDEMEESEKAARTERRVARLGVRLSRACELRDLLRRPAWKNVEISLVQQARQLEAIDIWVAIKAGDDKAIFAAAVQHEALILLFDLYKFVDADIKSMEGQLEAARKDLAHYLGKETADGE